MTPSDWHIATASRICLRNVHGSVRAQSTARSPARCHRHPAILEGGSEPTRHTPVGYSATKNPRGRPNISSYEVIPSLSRRDTRATNGLARLLSTRRRLRCSTVPRRPRCAGRSHAPSWPAPMTTAPATPPTSMQHPSMTHRFHPRNGDRVALQPARAPPHPTVHRVRAQVSARHT